MTDRIRFLRLAYIGLDVSDLGKSVDFYRGLVGLELVDTADGVARLRCSAKPMDIMLTQAEQPGLRRVSFELEDAGQIEVARERLTNSGLCLRDVAATEARELGFESGVRCSVPGSGLEVELIVGFADGKDYAPTLARIARLGHVVINTGDFGSSFGFWTRTLNFAVSDTVPGRIAFLRCFPNKYHHSLALIAAPADGYNHVNFMVSDIDDIGRGMNRMKKAGVPIVFGPGRHEPSGSIFLYFLDPDEMTAEYSFGMEEFDEHEARTPRELDPKPEVLDTWGSVPDERFAKKGIIVATDHA